MAIGSTFFDINYLPLTIAFGFFSTVFLLSELTRKIVDRYVSHGSSLYFFFIEAIASAQMCTCVYENIVILRHYGVIGFFFVVTTLLFANAFTNRGAFVSPLMPIELFVYRTIGTNRFLTILTAELLGAYSAFRIARQLWYWSMKYCWDHAVTYTLTSCSFVYRVPFVAVMLFEIASCFILRTMVGYSRNFKQYLLPPAISGLLTLALIIVGVPGLNPIVATSRLYGCDGLTTSWFLVVYWACPIIGWMASAYHQRMKAISSLKSD